MRILYVVAAHRPDLAAVLRGEFGEEPTVEIRLDRRQGQRRQRPSGTTPERRGGADRRGRVAHAGDLALLGYLRVIRPDP